MPPMTMSFTAKDAAMLRGFKEGDKVRFRAAEVKGDADRRHPRRREVGPWPPVLSLLAALAAAASMHVRRPSN
jgi:hypothetical protein